MASSSTLKPLPILPSSNSTLSSKSLKPSTIHFPSDISTLPSLKSKPSFKGYASPELLDTLEALDSFTESLDRENLEAIKVAAGSEIHGTPKISIEDDGVDKIKLTPKIRIKLRSYYVPLIEESCKLIMDAARTSNTKTIGPVYLPTKKLNLLCSQIPSWSQRCKISFQIRTHQRLIDILHPTEQTLESLMRLEFPFAVDVDVKL
ncbi:hypothetical protein MKW92_029735 [Papaver armeniacum]|nr:hypothetical protein MKW92_029735 [Papaver armeniacum]